MLCLMLSILLPMSPLYTVNSPQQRFLLTPLLTSPLVESQLLLPMLMYRMWMFALMMFGV